MLTCADVCRYVKAMIADMGVPEDVAVKYWLTKRREKVPPFCPYPCMCVYVCVCVCVCAAC